MTLRRRIGYALCLVFHWRKWHQHSSGMSYINHYYRAPFARCPKCGKHRHAHHERSMSE